MQMQQEADYQTIEYEIARLDRQIIFNLAQRFKYKELAKKINPDNNNNSVNDFKLMLHQRKQWAMNTGLNPSVVNKLSQYLIDYYLSERRTT